MLKKYFYPYLIYFVHRLLLLTWKVKIIESENFKKVMAENKGVVFAHWHADDPIVVLLIRPYKVAVMTSQSADGEMIDRITRLYGAKSVRGSSTRGAVGALKGLIRLTRQGFRPSLAVDGPKGPLHEVKSGIFELSRVLNAHICPVGGYVSKKHIFEKSWNKTYLPLPFSVITLYWGEPMAPLTRDQDPRDPQMAKELAKRISDCEVLAEKES